MLRELKGKYFKLKDKKVSEVLLYSICVYVILNDRYRLFICFMCLMFIKVYISILLRIVNG